MIRNYIFTVRHRNDFSGGVDLDCFLEAPAQPVHQRASAALRRMSGKPDVPQQDMKEFNNALFAMEMRSRFNGDIHSKILLVKVEDQELDRDILQNILDSKSGPQLKQFLQDAEF